MDISSPRLDFLLGKNRNRAAAGFKILGNGKWKSQAHIAALYPRNSNQVTVISIDHLPRFTPLLWRCRRGSSLACCCLMDLPQSKSELAGTYAHTQCRVYSR
jgi:hypothetical protein